jgi:hypothetical protein
MAEREAAVLVLVDAHFEETAAAEDASDESSKELRCRELRIIPLERKGIVWSVAAHQSTTGGGVMGLLTNWKQTKGESHGGETESMRHVSRQPGS